MRVLKNILNIVNDEYYFKVILFNMFNIFSYQKNAQDRLMMKVLWQRLTITKRRLKPKEIVELNRKYEDDSENVQIPIVKSYVETIDTLLNTNKSLSRYGDGEFNLIFGEDIPFQRFSKELAFRLKEIIVSNEDNIMVCVPDIFRFLRHYNLGTAGFWRKYAVLHREKIYDIIDMQKTYYDTQVTRVYSGLKDKSVCEEHFDKFKQIWKDKDVVIVEGVGSRLGVGNDLFFGAKSISRILCPQKDAFDKYDEIFDVCKQQSKDSLFILALGPTATVLAYDLAKEGYRALDVGHLDIEYEWMKMGATSKVEVEGKYVNEAKGGRKIVKINDEKYMSEIICDLSEQDFKNNFIVSLKEFLSRIYSLSINNDTHYLLKLFGFKIRFPKSEFKKKQQANPYYYYKNNNIDITTIPPATGQIRNIQLANLALLKELDYVCKQNSLNYWIDFGTLLGAIRHKGFIPWDDDIDTSMMRDDYNKLVELFAKSSRNSDIYAEQTYLGKSQTLIKVKHKKCPSLFVDVFPHDFSNMILTEEERYIQTKQLIKIRRHLTRNRFLNNTKKILSSIESLNKKRIPELTIDKSDIQCGLDYFYTEPVWFYPYDMIFPLKTIEFEGFQAMCINQPEKYMSEIFGDYMSYPKKIGYGHSAYNAISDEEKEIIRGLR